MKKILFALGAMVVSQAHGADISSDHILFGQIQSHSFGEMPKEAEQKLSFSANILSGIRVLPKKDLTGDTTSLATTYQYGWDNTLSLGASLAVLSEQLNQSIDGFERHSSPHLQGEFFLQYKLWQDQNFNIIVTPFIETGFAGSDHFSYGTKSRIGGIISTNIVRDQFGLGINGHYRFRPAEVHGQYRVASDFGYSIVPSIQIDLWNLWTEFKQTNTNLLNINRPGNKYSNHKTSSLAIGANFAISEENSLGVSYARGLSLDMMGTAAHRITIEYSMSFGSPRVEQQNSPKSDMTPSQRIYWLDQLRKNMAHRNKTVGSEMDGFTLNEGQESTEPLANTPEQDVKAADDEIKALKHVDKKIQDKAKSLSRAAALPSQELVPAQLPLNTTP